MMKGIENDFKSFAKDKFGISSLKLHDYASYISNGNYINPTIIEERQLNIAQLDVFSRLMMDRILFLGTEINSDVCNIINSQLLYLDSIGNGSIKLYINSPGGDVYSGLAVYDVMNFIKSNVETYCIGMCASMAAILLSSGMKGKRYSLPHGKIMIHQPSGGTGGRAQASDIEIVANEIKKCKSELYEILSKNTGQPYDVIEKDSDRDCWKTANEAKEYGLIDTVIS